MSEAEANASEHDAEHASSDDAIVEADKPNNRLIFVMVNAVILSIVGMVIAGWQIFVVSVNEEIQKKVWQAGGTELRELRAQEEGRLGHYQWVSQKDGVVRIPVSRARELVLRDWNLAPAAPAPSAVPAPAESAAPAPSASASASASAAPSTSASAAPSASAPPAASVSASAHPAPSAASSGK